jgi:FkbM family methyltransferase
VVAPARRASPDVRGETVDRVENPDLIFDVGAHKGEDSDFYLKLGYRVVAVEANPALAAELRERFDKAIELGHYTVVENAVADTNGTVSFFVNKTKSLWGTIDPKWADRNEKVGAASEEIAVTSIRFPDLITQYGCPNYLKLDVEGADMMCVNALTATGCRPRYISLESTKTSWRELRAEFKTLQALGYTKFKVVRQGRHKSGEFTCVDGRTVSYSFDVDASGPFGDDLAGRWLTRRQALLRYLPIFFSYKTMGDTTALARRFGHVRLVHRVLNFLVGWYDTHAMRE